MASIQSVLRLALTVVLGVSLSSAFTTNSVLLRQKRIQTDSATAIPLVKAAKGLAGDLISKMKWNKKNLDPETSANLYMDPATTKIANITISWEPQTAEKIRKLELEKKVKEFKKLGDDAPGRPFMVGVVGIPGSGKSTSSEILSSILSGSIVMPMDGYHIPMAELEKLPDATDAIYRRGAPDTFDPASLEKALERIVNSDEPQVSIPGFDHAKGDPEKDKHTFVRSEHSIVIAEGIYLMHQADGWENIKSFFDYIIYIKIDVDTCVARLKERNKCIPGYTPEEIEIRCEVVDRKNAETVEKSRIYATEEVVSGAA